MTDRSPRLDNARTLRRLIAELEALSLSIVERDPALPVAPAAAGPSPQPEPRQEMHTETAMRIGCQLFKVE